MYKEIAAAFGWYLIGAVVGAYTGKLIAEKILDAQAEKEWEEEPSEDITEEYRSESQLVLFERDKKGTKVTAPVKKVDYTRYAPKPALSELVKNHIDEDARNTVEEVDPDKPYIIPEDTYMQDEEYEKVSLTYFAGDDVLMEEDESVVSNPDDILGPDALTKFGEQSNDPDIVFVRNEKLRIDYEVTQQQNTFAEEILGEVPEKPKKRRARKPKAKIDIDESEPED